MEVIMRIGETITDELKAAGVLGLPFSWASDGTLYFETGVTVEQRQAIEAVFAAHVPPTQESLDRATEIRRINAHRNISLDAGVLWHGRRWHMDDVMRSALQWRITRWQLGRLAANAALPVRAMDNTIHQLGRDDHLALAEAIEAAGGAIYAESWAAKDAL
jgi:hypothetical protein